MGAYLTASNTPDRTIKFVIFSDNDNNPGEIIYNSESIQGGDAIYKDLPVFYKIKPGAYWIGVAENPKDQYWPQLRFNDGTYQYRLVKIDQNEYDNLSVGKKFIQLSNTPISGENRNYGLKINF